MPVTTQPNPSIEVFHSAFQTLNYEVEIDASTLPANNGLAFARATVRINDVVDPELTYRVDKVHYQISGNTYKYSFNIGGKGSTTVRFLAPNSEVNTNNQIESFLNNALSTDQSTLNQHAYALVDVTFNYFYIDSSDGLTKQALITEGADTIRITPFQARYFQGKNFNNVQPPSTPSGQPVPKAKLLLDAPNRIVHPDNFVSFCYINKEYHAGLSPRFVSIQAFQNGTLQFNDKIDVGAQVSTYVRYMNISPSYLINATYVNASNFTGNYDYYNVVLQNEVAGSFLSFSETLTIQLRACSDERIHFYNRFGVIDALTLDTSDFKIINTSESDFFEQQTNYERTGRLATTLYNQGRGRQNIQQQYTIIIRIPVYQDTDLFLVYQDLISSSKHWLERELDDKRVLFPIYLESVESRVQDTESADTYLEAEFSVNIFDDTGEW